MTTKTICLENSYELHIDPILGSGDIELAIKRRSRWGVDELARIRVPNRSRIEAAAVLLGDDLNAIVKGLAVGMMKEAA